MGTSILALPAFAAPQTVYEEAVKNLFPPGEYWEERLADPASDVSLFCKAKAAWIYRFRLRMEALRKESLPGSSAELINEWESTLLNAVFPDLPLAERQAALTAWPPWRINLKEIRAMALKCNLRVFDLSFPQRSSALPLICVFLEGDSLSFALDFLCPRMAGARFGSARFGTTPLACIEPLGEEVLKRLRAAGFFTAFENWVRPRMLAGQVTTFTYVVDIAEADLSVLCRSAASGGANAFCVYEADSGKFIGTNVFDWSREDFYLPALVLLEGVL